jgi:hypothetical protein
MKIRKVSVREAVEKRTFSPRDLLGDDLCPGCGGHYKAALDGPLCRSCALRGGRA